MIDTIRINTTWKNIKIMKKVFDLFGHKNIFFVGGAVRDCILGQPLRDIDLAVKNKVSDVKKKLHKAKINFVDNSKGHGTVSLIYKENSIEITSMRVDKETFGRKAKVEFTDSIYLDSCRRDFTINSIYSSFNGEVYDPHKGIYDLEKRKVRFIGEPLTRIKEDKLRVLRYYRFLSYYGFNTTTLDKSSMKAARECFNLIKCISVERKSEEFFKLIMGRFAADTIILMKKQKVLNFLIPGLGKIKNVDIKALDDLKYEKMIRTSYLLIISKFNLEKIRACLHLSKKDYLHMKEVCENFKSLKINSVIEARLAKYKLGKHISTSIYYLKCFIDKKNVNKKIIYILEKWNVAEFPVNGKDLQKIGLVEGTEMGLILAKVRLWWQNKDFKPSKKQCLRKCKALMSNNT